MTQQIDLHVYGRVSRIDVNKPQDQQDKSLTIQTQAFHDACTSLIPALFAGRVGNIVGSYSDEGKSASRKRVKRPDFTRLLTDIESNVVKVLMVMNLSRFSRLNHLDAMRLHLTLHDHNTILVSIDDRKIIGIEDLMQFLEVAFKSNNDHEYARTVAKNTLRGSIKNIRDGQAKCKDTPYGMAKLYITEHGEEKLVARGDRISKGKDWKVYLVKGDAKQADIVNWIFKTYADDDISPAYIARQLNRHEDAIVRVGLTGKGWSEETVKHILRNHHYNGKVFIGAKTNGEHYRTNSIEVATAKEVKQPNPLIVPSKIADKYPPVIADDLFNKVQAKIQHNKQVNHRAITSDDREGHCLTGVLFCGHCGRSLYCFNAKNLRYQCKNRVSGCKCWSVAENEMLPFLLKKIDKELLKQLDCKPSEKGNGHDDNRKRLEDIDRRISALQATLKTASIESIPTVSKAIDDLHQDRNKVSQSIVHVCQHDRIQAAYDRWEALMQPFLIGIKTGKEGEGNNAVKHLGIQDEIDRLFNTTWAKPSSIRNLLHSLDCRVECWFNELGKHCYDLDRGRLQCTIDGQLQTNNLNPSR